MSDITLIYSNIYGILNYIILFGGIFLIKFFTDKLEYRKSYKPAILISIIWFLIAFFVLGILVNMIIFFILNNGGDFVIVENIIIIMSVVRILLNFITISLLD